MKNDYYQNKDENFNEVLKLVEKTMSHKELISMLKNGNIPQKQLAAIRLNNLENTEDANILLDNLVGQDGKIREVVSLKIKEFVSDNKLKELFDSLDKNKLTDSFLSGLIDTNSNICRNILDTLICFKQDKTFTDMFIEKLVKLVYTQFDKIKQIEIKDGKYVMNKEVFKIYWCLEAINIYFDLMDTDTLKNILSVTGTTDEYTIREKTAKILTNNINDKELLTLRSKLQNDENYYVRTTIRNF